MARLNFTGLHLNLTTLIGIIGKMVPAVAALPEVADLISAAASVLSGEDKDKLQAVYQAKIAATDAAHGQTQEALEQAAHPEDNSSPKGGAL